MASFIYTNTKVRLANGLMDWDSIDVRAILCMAATDADTNRAADALSDLTLAEYDGTGYTRAQIANEIITQDDVNFLAKLDGDDATFGAAVAAATGSAVGMILYQHVDGTAANDKPIAWIDSGGFPVNGNGGPLNVEWHADGILRIT